MSNYSSYNNSNCSGPPCNGAPYNSQFYNGPPPAFLATPPPAVPVEVVSALQTMTIENQQLQAKMARQVQKEQAYSAVYGDWDGSLFVIGPSGKHIRLLNHQVDLAYHFIPRPPYRDQEFYAIYLCDVDEPLQVTPKEYGSDSALIAALQEIPNVVVTTVKSQKVTANLLRGVFGVKMEQVYPHFYGGWYKAREDPPKFWAFSDGRTHQNQGEFRDAKRIPKTSAALAAVAAEKLWPIFQVIRNRTVRTGLFFWYHVSALHTLLKMSGVANQLGLSIFAPDAAVQDYLSALFCWHRDPPLSLEQPPADFSLSLLSRKDQPLVVRDHGRSRNAQANASLLEEAMTSDPDNCPEGGNSSVYRCLRHRPIRH